MRKTKIETIKIIFIVKALTIIIFNIAHTAESMKDLSMTVVLSVEIIKKRSYQNDNFFVSIGRYKLTFNICYIYNNTFNKNLSILKGFLIHI